MNKNDKSPNTGSITINNKYYYFIKYTSNKYTKAYTKYDIYFVHSTK